jgi:hypothetical protein
MRLLLCSTLFHNQQPLTWQPCSHKITSFTHCSTLPAYTTAVPSAGTHLAFSMASLHAFTDLLLLLLAEGQRSPVNYRWLIPALMLFGITAQQNY